MENITNKEPPDIASFLIEQHSKNANEATPEKAVIHDECGDSLWDAVLAQEDKSLLAKDDSENKDMPYEKDKL